MSSAEHVHLDAKNRSKNTVKYSHVMCFGTFDILHPGHHFYLSESQKRAEKMTIVIARDHRVASGKGRDPVYDEQTRLQGVQSAYPIAQVILGHASDIFAPIRDISPDLLSFGYDQRVPEERVKELFPHIDILRIGGYEIEKWKSSILRDRIRSRK